MGEGREEKEKEEAIKSSCFKANGFLT